MPADFFARAGRPGFAAGFLLVTTAASCSKLRAVQNQDSDAEGAGEVDIYKYRRRRRGIYAVLVGAALAGVVALGLEMVDARRNPCQRLRDYLCGLPDNQTQCKIYEDLLQDSLHDESSEMRGQILGQCETRIKNLKADDGVDVR